MSNALDALLDETVARGLAQGLEQGLQQGLEQGIQQGMQQGEVTGERRLLRRYLQQRFGAIPAPLDARIEQANAETLVAMFDQALVSRAIDELARPAPDGGVS